MFWNKTCHVSHRGSIWFSKQVQVQVNIWRIYSINIGVYLCTSVITYVLYTLSVLLDISLDDLYLVILPWLFSWVIWHLCWMGVSRFMIDLRLHGLHSFSHLRVGEKSLTSTALDLWVSFKPKQAFVLVLYSHIIHLHLQAESQRWHNKDKRHSS